jgi:hypothetical protein
MIFRFFCYKPFCQNKVFCISDFWPFERKGKGEIKEFYPRLGSLLSYTLMVKFTTQGVEDALF